MTKVFGMGRPTLDRLVRVPRPPEFGASMRVEHLGYEGGGPVSTALVACRRLGLEAAMAARLGRDDTATEIIAGLEREGVDVRHVVQADDARSASSIILITPDAERSILHDPGVGTDVQMTDELLGDVARADGLLLDRATPAALAASRHARDNGTLVVLDAGGSDERVMELVPSCDVVIGSSYHATTRGLSPEEAVDELLDHGVHVAVITLGEKGSIGRARDGGLVVVPAMRVVAVDTTGAGDVYHGAFLTAWLERPDLAFAMRFAAVVAALKCGKPGGRAGIPNRREADEALARLGSGRCPGR